MSTRIPNEGRYSKVSRRVWGSVDFRALSAPKPNAQTLWLRLLTGPELGIIPGLFEVRESGLAEALAWPLSAFRRCLQEITARGMATHDKAVGLMWVPRAIRHNPPDNPNVILGWKVAWKDLPECSTKETARVHLIAWAAERGKGWVDAMANVLGNPSHTVTPNDGGNSETESDSETDSDADADSEGSPAAAPVTQQTQTEPERKPDPEPTTSAKIRCPVPVVLPERTLANLEMNVGLPRAVALRFLLNWSMKQDAKASDVRFPDAWIASAFAALTGEWSDTTKRAAMRAAAAAPANPADVQREREAAEREVTERTRRELAERVAESAKRASVADAKAKLASLARGEA